MSPDLRNKLIEGFPNLYRERPGRADLNHPGVVRWGFDVEDGWYDIIYRLSQTLEAMILALPDVILEGLYPTPERREEFYAAQVKEKFGGLRFYMKRCTNEMRAAISQAEEEAKATCIYCGEPGTTKDGFQWHGPSCDICHRRMLIKRTESRLDLLVRFGIYCSKEEWNELQN